MIAMPYLASLNMPHLANLNMHTRLKLSQSL